MVGEVFRLLKGVNENRGKNSKVLKSAFTVAEIMMKKYLEYELTSGVSRQSGEEDRRSLDKMAKYSKTPELKIKTHKGLRNRVSDQY